MKTLLRVICVLAATVAVAQKFDNQQVKPKIDGNYTRLVWDFNDDIRAVVLAPDQDKSVLKNLCRKMPCNIDEIGTMYYLVPLKK